MKTNSWLSRAGRSAMISVMRAVVLPFFLIRLGLALLPWLGEVMWTVRVRWVPVLLLTGLLVGQGRWMYQLWTSRPVLPATDQVLSLGLVPAITQLPINELYTYTFSPIEVASQLAELHSWLALQPRHRDVLLNLSILYTLNQQPGPAQAALSEAQLLDPNSQLFVPPSPTPGL